MIKVRKKLCFHCDEKFIIGHHCKNQILFRMEVIAEEEDED